MTQISADKNVKNLRLSAKSADRKLATISVHSRFLFLFFLTTANGLEEK